MSQTSTTNLNVAATSDQVNTTANLTTNLAVSPSANTPNVITPSYQDTTFTLPEKDNSNAEINITKPADYPQVDWISNDYWIFEEVHEWTVIGYRHDYYVAVKADGSSTQTGTVYLFDSRSKQMTTVEKEQFVQLAGNDGDRYYNSGRTISFLNVNQTSGNYYKHYNVLYSLYNKYADDEQPWYNSVSEFIPILGPLVVHYQDQTTGQEIISSTEIAMMTGNSYDVTNPPKIDGYTYVGVKNNTTGHISNYNDATVGQQWDEHFGFSQLSKNSYDVYTTYTYEGKNTEGVGKFKLETYVDGLIYHTDEMDSMNPVRIMLPDGGYIDLANPSLQGENDVTFLYKKNDTTPTKQTGSFKVQYVLQHADGSRTVLYTTTPTNDPSTTGNYGDIITYDPSAKISSFENNQGYKYVSSNYNQKGQVFSEVNNNQTYTVVLATKVDNLNVIYRDVTDAKNPQIIGSSSVTGDDGATIDFTKNTNEIKTLEGQGYKLENNGFTGETAGTTLSSANNGKTYYVDFTKPNTPTKQSDTFKVEYIDEDDNNKLLESATVTGETGAEITYKTAPSIQTYENEGYKLDKDDYTDAVGSKMLDSYNNQTYKVYLKHDTETIGPKTPNKPTDGDKINPNDPRKNSPTWKDTNVSESFTDTVHYVVSDDKVSAPKDNVQKSTWTRMITVDKVTGEILPVGQAGSNTTNWTPDKTSYNEVTTPELAHYYADKASVPATATVQKNISTTVTYKPLGRIIPVDPNGKQIPNTDHPQYNNDPQNPTKGGKTNIPDVPGYQPQNPNQTTVTPTDPGKDTPVVYVQNQHAHVIFVDEDENNKVLNDSGQLTGQPGAEIVDPNYAATLASYEKLGYVLSKDKNNQYLDAKLNKYDNDPTKDQTLYVYLQHGIQNITPGQPLNPNDPNGPKGPNTYTDNNGKTYKLTKDATQTITTHYTDGSKPDTSTTTTKKDAFIKTITIDKVTGKVIQEGNFTGSYTFGSYSVPIVPGYYADKTNVGGKTATPDDPNVKDQVNYSPLGKIIPVDPKGNPIKTDGNNNPTKTPQYNNDPQDPTKGGKTNIPDVPGYQPQNPNQTTVTPTDPGKDTKVVYTKPSETMGTAVVHFLDEDQNDQLITESGSLSGKLGTKITYADYQTVLQNLENEGYILSTDKQSDYPTQKTYTKDNQVLNVYLKHGHTTITVTTPKDQMPKNGDKINPNDPRKNPPTWTETQVEKQGSQTVHYVVSDGKTSAPKDNVQTSTWTRTITVDKVTGETTTTTWTPDQPKYQAVPTPTLPGYTPSTNEVPANPTTPGTTTITVTYSPTKTPDNPVVTTGKITITYVDQDNHNTPLKTDTITGNYGDKITYTTTTEIKHLEDQGYVLVTDGFNQNGQNFGEDNNGKTYTVVLKHGTTTVTPSNPQTPGQPINPNDPNGPKYTKDQTDVTRDATQTITYHYSDGSQPDTQTTSTEKNAFTRTVTVDKVTGKTISTTPWTGSHTFGKVNTPVIQGYHADKKTAGGLTATPDHPDVTDQVVYTPNGKIIPVDPNGNKIPDVPTPTYPTDPTDPTKVVPDEPVPTIPGYTPTVKTVTPTNPGEDTPVVYVQKVTPSEPVTPTTPKNPTSPTNPSAPVAETPAKLNNQTGQVTTTPETEEQTTKQVSPAPAKKLPQTGNETASGLVAAGLVGLLGSLGFGLKKKREH